MLYPAVKGTVVCHSKEIDNPRVEIVYPETVVVSGAVTMSICYTGVTEEGHLLNNWEQRVRIPFHFFIDREDANGGDPYHISGMELLGGVVTTEENTEFFVGQEVFRKIVLKEILMVCVQRGSR